jgi:DDHD domain
MNHLAFSLNEIASKFMQRNVDFKGEISLIATSFEALFLFDLLLNQETASDFWKLKFSPANFYAFGMPSNLLTIRNGPRLQMSFELKNCKKFLNIVHRLDPVAQRIEPIIKPEFAKMPPESIESESTGRTDYTIADGSSLESFSIKNYFTSELVILRITNEIYGALKMDSGSL